MEKYLEDSKKKILTDKTIKEFCTTNKIDEQTFFRFLPKLKNQYEENKACAGCTGSSCPLQYSKYQGRLVYYHGNIDIKYYPCGKAKRVNQDFLEMLFMPIDISLVEQDLIINEKRANVMKLMTQFKSNYKNQNGTKGIYIHGAFGTGKTFLLLKLAQDLAYSDIKVLFAYYPDLVRQIKSSISLGGMEGYIEKLKKVEVLMLDDIGAENNTAFIRDEVLGPILQYRMNAMLPTFMTSNSSISSLREHFSEVSDEVNKTKSDRIIERIKYMMVEVRLDDKNYRL